MNLDLIKAALQEKDNPDQRRGGGSDKLWRLDAGDSEAEALARIVPYKFDEDNPFLEMWFHYGVAGRNYLCPRKHGDGECVICKFLCFSVFVLINCLNSKNTSICFTMKT